MCVCTRFLVADVDVQSQDYEQGDEGGPPVDDEHYDHAQHRPGQGHPLVVVLKARTPPCGETAKHSPGKWTHSSLKAHVRDKCFSQLQSKVGDSRVPVNQHVGQLVSGGSDHDVTDAITVFKLFRI